jgi:hypothetical protein
MSYNQFPRISIIFYEFQILTLDKQWFRGKVLKMYIAGKVIDRKILLSIIYDIK